VGSSPRDVFLALVHGVADGRWEELPGLYAEQTDVVHPFDPLRGPALRSRDELRAHFRPTGEARGWTALSRTSPSTRPPTPR
jgi:hypothetical protein